LFLAHKREISSQNSSEKLDIRKNVSSEGLEGTAISEFKEVLCHRNIGIGISALYVDIQGNPLIYLKRFYFHCNQ
jgi:hypothetical protein